MDDSRKGGRAGFGKVLHAIPLIGPAAGAAYDRLKGRDFPGSQEYWERRYRRGGTSGAGSYNRLALFKAEILNDFVAGHGVQSVIELGCGDGHQLSLAKYPRYVGLDVSPTAVESCKARFNGDTTKQFYVTGSTPASADEAAELALSLDVIYHLVEDAVFSAYMHELFTRAQRHVIVYASNRDEPGDASHVRHRCFTQWVSENCPAWALQTKIDNRYPYVPGDPNTSFADFYIFARREA